MNNDHDYSETTYTQSMFRTLLNCMARPGTLGRLNQKLNFGRPGKPFTNYFFGIALTLLDQEVLFHIWNEPYPATAQLQAYTMSRPGKLEDCDYLLVSGADLFDINRLKKGSWQFPDESATIICQVESLATPEVYQKKAIHFELRGPGIPQVKTISVSGLNPALVEPWRQCNREFPLGLDWILVDLLGQVCCLPRSTIFSEELC